MGRFVHQVLHACGVQAERNEVSRAEADVAFQEGRYVHAAQLWGRIRSAEPSFEEVALRFVGAAATDALQEFLLARLQVLSPEDKAQVCCLAQMIAPIVPDGRKLMPVCH